MVDKTLKEHITAAQNANGDLSTGQEATALLSPAVDVALVTGAGAYATHVARSYEANQVMKHADMAKPINGLPMILEDGHILEQSAHGTESLYKFADNNETLRSFKGFSNALKPSALVENLKYAVKEHPKLTAIVAGTTALVAGADYIIAKDTLKHSNQAEAADGLAHAQQVYEISSPDTRTAIAEAVLNKKPVGEFSEKILNERNAQGHAKGLV